MITVNGAARQHHSQTIAQIIAEFGLDPERPGIAVAVNGAVAPRDDWPARRLEDEDRVEIVQAKTGG